MATSEQSSFEIDQDSDERSPLVSADGPPIEATRIRKLQCLVFGLVLVVFGFVAALNEGSVTYHEMHEVQPNKSSWPWYLRDDPNLWACWIIKCAQLLMGIVSIAYLQRKVMQPDRIPRASFNISPAEPQSRYSFGKLQRFQELPENLAYYPTKMFVSIFIIFAILGAICSIAETIGDLIDSINPDVYEILPYVDVLRCILLFAFIALQTYFFTKNNRFCLNWKLDNAWMAMSIVLATNLSLWFFYVSHEMSEIVAAKSTCVTNSTLKQELREQLSVVAEIMFPFLIEFFLMSAILGGSFLANAGRLASVLRELHGSIRCLTADAIRDKLFIPHVENRRPSNFMGHLRKHSRSLILGLALVVSAIVISVLMKLLVCKREPWHILSIYILVVCFVSGSVCCVVLLRAFRSAPGEASVETKARTAADRLMLWCCVVAVATNDLNRFWRVFGSDKELANAIGTGLVTIFDILQSVLQVYVLECILLKRIRSSDVLVRGSHNLGAFLLTILMVINALEWLVSAVAFSLFFFDSSAKSNTASMALLVICAPLQVFFRFHSVGCIHEFRKHFRDDNDDNVQGDQPTYRVPLDFPTITRPNELIA